jgi:hypothetical protein
MKSAWMTTQSKSVRHGRDAKRRSLARTSTSVM